VLQPSFWYVNTLDTVGGTLPISAQVTLGTVVLDPAVPVDIQAWTSLPNNVVDVVALNDTSTALNLLPALGGIYFITPTGVGDFLNFTEAIDSLVEVGVCSPTTFIVDLATYNERVVIPDIDNTSDVNTIRFTSLNGNT